MHHDSSQGPSEPGEKRLFRRGPTRLSIHRETIRTLQVRDSERLAGKVTGVPCPSLFADTECCALDD